MRFLRHSDGHRVPVRIRSVPVRDEHGAIIGACQCFDERVSLLPAARHALQIELRGSIDEVTGCPGREAIVRRLEDDLRYLRTAHLPFGVLCLSVDDFDSLRAQDGAAAVQKVLEGDGPDADQCRGTGQPGGALVRWAVCGDSGWMHGREPIGIRGDFETAGAPRRGALVGRPADGHDVGRRNHCAPRRHSGGTGPARRGGISSRHGLWGESGGSVISPIVRQDYFYLCFRLSESQLCSEQSSAVT